MRHDIKKNLVTGVSGLLGSEVARFLIKNGQSVLGVFNQNPQLVNPDIERVRCDISDPSSVNFLSRAIDSADLVIHCAALTNVSQCETDKKACFRANVVGTRNMVILAKKLGAKLIYVSTPSVFDGVIGNYKENDTPNPKNFYSLSKLLGEEAALSYKQSLIIRVAPIGLHPLGRPPVNFFEWLLDSVKNNKTVNLFTDINFNPISAASLARIILEAERKMGNGVFHIGSRNFLSKAEVGRLVLSRYPGFNGTANFISVAEMPEFSNRPREMWLNINKALNFGIELPDFEKELDLLLNKHPVK